MNKRSQLFSRAVNYLTGHRPALAESKVPRKGLAKQYGGGARFRQRVGIRQKMLALGPRGTAGEELVPAALDEESDCGSCQSWRVKSTLPADRYYRKRKAARAEQRAKAVVYATIQVILDSGASHNVVPKEWVKHLEWEPAEGPAGFRAADGSWLPNLGTAVVSLKSAEGFSFKVRFSVASVQRALLSATQVLKQRHTILLKGSKATIHVKGKPRQGTDL